MVERLARLQGLPSLENMPKRASAQHMSAAHLPELCELMHLATFAAASSVQVLFRSVLVQCSFVCDSLEGVKRGEWWTVPRSEPAACHAQGAVRHEIGGKKNVSLLNPLNGHPSHGPRSTWRAHPLVLAP